MGTEISSPIHLHITDFQLIEKALMQLARKNRGNAEKTKTGYGTCRSADKHDTLIAEADECEYIISRIAQEFS
jgi:hypothetical protein